MELELWFGDKHDQDSIKSTFYWWDLADDIYFFLTTQPVLPQLWGACQHPALSVCVLSHLFGCLLWDVQLPQLLQKHRVDILRLRAGAWLLWWLHSSLENRDTHWTSCAALILMTQGTTDGISSYIRSKRLTGLHRQPPGPWKQVW